MRLSLALRDRKTPSERESKPNCQRTVLILSLNYEYNDPCSTMEENRTKEVLLCLGGSFNPLHNGHLACAKAAAIQRGLPHVCLVPSAQPPHKVRHNDMASAADRLKMCQLAAAEEPLLRVSDIEVARGGPSYTFDTVTQFRAMGYRRVEWLIGADMLACLPKWHRAGELIQIATILIMARPGVELNWDALPSEFQSLRSNRVDTPLLDISATEIRRRIRAGEPFDHWVPLAVARYIRQAGLYSRCSSGEAGE